MFRADLMALADLYHHRVCLPAYASKYNKATNEHNNKREVKTALLKRHF